MPAKNIVQPIIDELTDTEDWVSIAGALGALDISAFTATPDQIRGLITNVEKSELLRVGTVGPSGFTELQADELRGIIARITAIHDPSQRVGEMMGLFIDAP